MHIKLLERGLPVEPIYWALRQNPQLWNEHKERTEDPDSPHHGLDDIWVRFGAPERVKDSQPHESVWYPSAKVLECKGLCLDVMRAVSGERLGGVLITRIPPGKECKPHKDPGWHATTYEKFAVQIASAPGQKFCFDNEELETRPGDLYWFDNQHTHWVLNPTEYERVTMIVCVRKED